MGLGQIEERAGRDRGNGGWDGVQDEWSRKGLKRSRQVNRGVAEGRIYSGVQVKRLTWELFMMDVQDCSRKAAFFRFCTTESSWLQISDPQ